jgi:hypothetical protein
VSGLEFALKDEQHSVDFYLDITNNAVQQRMNKITQYGF